MFKMPSPSPTRPALTPVPDFLSVLSPRRGKDERCGAAGAAEAGHADLNYRPQGWPLKILVPKIFVVPSGYINSSNISMMAPKSSGYYCHLTNYPKQSSLNNHFILLALTGPKFRTSWRVAAGLGGAGCTRGGRSGHSVGRRTKRPRGRGARRAAPVAVLGKASRPWRGLIATLLHSLAEALFLSRNFGSKQASRRRGFRRLRHPARKAAPLGARGPALAERRAAAPFPLSLKLGEPDQDALTGRGGTATCANPGFRPKRKETSPPLLLPSFPAGAGSVFGSWEPRVENGRTNKWKMESLEDVDRLWQPRNTHPPGLVSE